MKAPDDLAQRLGDEVRVALGPWVRGRLVGLNPALIESTVVAVEELVMIDLASALARDVDDPGPSPLAVIRRAAGPMTAALSAAGIEPPVRDAQQIELFPHDTYDLVPASFADLSPAAAEAGIAWGAGRAFTHRQRHGSTAND